MCHQWCIERHRQNPGPHLGCRGRGLHRWRGHPSDRRHRRNRRFRSCNRIGHVCIGAGRRYAPGVCGDGRDHLGRLWSPGRGRHRWCHRWGHYGGCGEWCLGWRALRRTYGRPEFQSGICCKWCVRSHGDRRSRCGRAIYGLQWRGWHAGLWHCDTIPNRLQPWSGCYRPSLHRCGPSRCCWHGCRRCTSGTGDGCGRSGHCGCSGSSSGRWWLALQSVRQQHRPSGPSDRWHRAGALVRSRQGR